ncbi:TPA: hypothetical protein N0F65_004249 [Lagenidium giganteum]|uniref:Amino acid transporter n=1 Tax=Lagenidium giganteum TaxID=4803 RepID=A0AAV2ZCW6_9STRA|nr:TPA: hypothetical protein N0F65_004249 [Lagenidium giganteum]
MRRPSGGFGFHHDEDTVAYPDDDGGWLKRTLSNSNAQIMLGVVSGVAAGVLMSHMKASADVTELVNLPGKLFLRLLRLLVIPMVFASLTTGIVNIVQLGKVSAVGSRTTLYFMAMSTVASVLSLTVALSLRSLQPSRDFAATSKPQAFLSIACSNNKYFEMYNDSSMACTADAVSNPTTKLELVDLSGAIIQGAVAKVDLSEQITDILFSVFPNNIVDSFQQGVLVGIITFSIFFGAAAMKTAEHERSVLLATLAQLNDVFIFIITKLIDLSPIAVFSLVASSLGSQRSMGEAANYVGVLVLCQLEVSRALLQFVVTIGCTVHMNGTAMLFPNAVVFLASTASTDIDVGWVQMIIIIVVSVLGSIGVAPIPNAGLVMIFSVWSSAFPNHELPATFSYIVAIYWYIDRVNTFCNVVGDTYIARIIAEQVDETYESTSDH